jgi:DNA-binding transcriptional MerR regulator
MVTERLLTQSEAAELLHVQARTLESWRMRGIGPKFVRYTSRAIRYRPADLRAFLELHEVAPAGAGR